MIPKKDLEHDFEIVEQPSSTYRLNIERNNVAGLTDKLEAVKQAIYLILSVERFEHSIYSWNYGVELVDLVGKPMPFVIPELKRRIVEALTQDGRIAEVNNFKFKIEKRKLCVAFTVRTVFGDIETEKVVQV
ncbi:MAG: DUF2634 domain-containing protein [Alkaliphilus sp.]